MLTYLCASACSALQQIQGSMGDTTLVSKGPQEWAPGQGTAQMKPRIALGVDSLTILMLQHPVYKVHDSNPAASLPYARGLTVCSQKLKVPAKDVSDGSRVASLKPLRTAVCREGGVLWQGGHGEPWPHVNMVSLKLPYANRVWITSRSSKGGRVQVLEWVDDVLQHPRLACFIGTVHTVGTHTLCMYPVHP